MSNYSFSSSKQSTLSACFYRTKSGVNHNSFFWSTKEQSQHKDTTMSNKGVHIALPLHKTGERTAISFYEKQEGNQMKCMQG